MHTGLLRFPFGMLPVEVATTAEERRVGLAGRPVVPEDLGMLLPGTQAVWMVGMRVPIDVIFLGATPASYVVLTWLRFVPPGTRTAHAVHGAAAVLEVRAGWTDRHPIRAYQTATLLG